MRDVEPVLAAEGEEEVVARDAGDLLRLEAEQLADAVVLVHDVVAGAEVGEGGERAAEAAVGARRPLAEDLRVGQQHEPELAPDEAAAGRRDGEEELGLLRELVARLEQRASTRRSRFCVRSASPRCGKATTTRWPPRTKAASSCLGLGEAARRDRGPLRLERERLRLRERVELGGALSGATGSRPSSAQTRAHLVRLPDEVGRAVERRDEVVRDAAASRRRRDRLSARVRSARRSAAG